ncbi:MAG: phosphoserine transaminase, partial [Pseudomonadota bacterium]
MTDMPSRKPARPQFSSGPCSKRPGWSLDNLATDSLGRSHRSGLAKGRLQEVIDRSRQVLEVPDTHRIAIVSASDTGAVEMAMWSMLGPRPVTVIAWESFGKDWVTDTVKELKIDPRVMVEPFGQLPDINSVDPSHDVIFTWNGTTSGIRVPNGDWIADDREGLTICDATSAAFAMELPWDKLDVTTYSWQKVLGGEAQHGILILGPRAVERLESHTPTWPVPKIFRMTKNGKLNEGIFKGATINTPSMLCVEDCIDTLKWAESIGGWRGMKAKADENAAVIDDWVQRTPWIRYMAPDISVRSNTGVCLLLQDERLEAMDDESRKEFVKRMVKR